MRAVAITIHNFRTLLDCAMALSPYSLLVGPNNSGKTNVIDAIRVFYEKDAKFDVSRDFPKMATSDRESWIEIEYKPSPGELATLKDEYHLSEGTFRVRKYLQSEEADSDGKAKSGIYAYTGGKLSNSRFYGAKNVQQGKLGEVIYIPAVSKLEDYTKLTGPSAFRDLLNGILKPLLESSPSYATLGKSIETFAETLKKEKASGGRSIEDLESDLTTEISEWGASFEITVNPISPDDLVKALIGHRVHDTSLSESMEACCFGQGFQRHLIFALIHLAARYASTPARPSQREFSPRLVWFLFEEPEAFLHPPQIESLDAGLRAISQDPGNQVLISTHNPQFVSCNVDELPSLVHLSKKDAYTSISQVTPSELQSIFELNRQQVAGWQASGIAVSIEDLQLDMEAAKHALWLNPLRCNAFFALKVLLVEGPTDQAIIRYLLRQPPLSDDAMGVFVMDTMGKYNMHRFMNLFGALGIHHSVLYDQDGGRQAEIEKTIRESANSFTLGVDCFAQDIETELGIPPAGRPDRKPQHALCLLRQGKLDPSRLSALSSRICSLLSPGIAKANESLAPQHQ